jgi:hypothetical protein
VLFSNVSHYQLFPLTGKVSVDSIRLRLSYFSEELFLLGFLKRPSLDGDVPFFKESPKVLFIDTEMSTWQTVGLQPVTLDPVEHGALTYLAVGSDVAGSEFDNVLKPFLSQGFLLFAL